MRRMENMMSEFMQRMHDESEVRRRTAEEESRKKLDELQRTYEQQINTLMSRLTQAGHTPVMAKLENDDKLLKVLNRISSSPLPAARPSSGSMTSVPAKTPISSPLMKTTIEEPHLSSTQSYSRASKRDHEENDEDYKEDRGDYEEDEEELLPRDLEEEKVKLQEKKRKDKIIYENEKDESHLESYVEWLIKRERLYPFAEDTHKKLYARRHTLLGPYGRLMEWIRTAFYTKFDERLFGKYARRWFIRFMQDRGEPISNHSVSRSVDVKGIQVPAMSYDHRDVLQRVQSPDGEDLLPDSYTLSVIPAPLRYTPFASELAPSHKKSLEEYGEDYVKQIKLLKVARTRDDDPTDSSSSDESSDEDDSHACEKCGVKLTSPYMRFCLSCLQARQQHKLHKKEKERLATLAMNQRLGMPSLQSDPVRSSSSLPIPNVAVVNSVVTRVKQEEDLAAIRQASETHNRVSQESDQDLLEESVSILGDVLGHVFTSSARGILRYGKVNMNYTARDRMAAVRETVAYLGKFGGEVMKAPTYLTQLCTQVQKYDLTVGECIQVLQQTFINEAKAWLDSNLPEVCTLPEDKKPMQLLMHRYMHQWMGPTTTRQFKAQLRNTKLTSNSATLTDLKQHYSSYVAVLNNVRLCDKSMKQVDINDEYYMSLPTSVAMYIGSDYKRAQTLDDIQKMAEEAIMRLPTHARAKQDGEMPRTLSSINSITMNRDDYNNQVRVNALPDSTSKRSHNASKPKVFNPARERQKLDKKQAVCYQCGKKGHYTGDCPLIEERQTLAGQELWAKRNRERGTEYEYNKQFYVDLAKQIAARESARSTSSSPAKQSKRNVRDNRRLVKEKDASEGRTTIEVSEDDEADEI
jgi:hypothetical protein